MNSETLKFIRCYSMRVYNDCNLLTYSRGMKDTDNNYYLLRIKDFLSDLYFCIFSGKSNNSNYNKVDLITIQDIFIIMHLVTETGKTWINLKNYDIRSEIAKKIGGILNYLKVKPNDMCIFVNQDLEYYNYLIDYLDFYIEKFVKEIKNNENIENISIIQKDLKVNNIDIEIEDNNKNLIIQEDPINNNANNKDNDRDNDNIDSNNNDKDKIIIDPEPNKEKNSSKNIFTQNNSNEKKERNNPTKSKKINHNDNIFSNSTVDEKTQNILEVLFLLKNVYFRSDHEKTK